MTKPQQPGKRGRPVPADGAEVKAGGWTEGAEPRRRPFPGPPQAAGMLRVAMTRPAYADLVEHVKAHLEAEVCGVLVGEVGEDNVGLHVSIEAIIRGEAAKAGGAHVTYTHETWEQIHAQMEESFPKLQIVGWYHSHPGFGVEFSDMDRFIQENFFSGPAQIAFVSDPLGGEEALWANTPTGPVNLDRFWVDGRERRCQVPAAGHAAPLVDGGRSPAGDLRAVEERLAQLIQVVEDQRLLWYRTVLTVGMIAGLSFIALVGYNVYEHMTARLRPPELQTFVPVPVQVGDQTVMLGIDVVRWHVPPELNAAYVELERQRQEAAASAVPSPTPDGPGHGKSAPPAPSKKDQKP